ncbi:hypothetical protein LSH36_909g00076 [Paralvinella palmiformis]|uniref:HECT-type E3 ubiquitin transferase n=1 Tax=Paralvinella palmiformis TaxID=53620 RepID=A0AAD9MT35_9ANNE|nr:hypothetical protein LSH36_909g00076 [Paralvinella palmiformis]
MNVDGQIRGIGEGDRPGTKVLRVHVLAGVNLAKKDIFGARMLCTLNPKWEEEFLFRVNPRKNKLVFEVFDENRVTRDDFLGLVELTLKHTLIGTETAERRPVPRDFILRPRSSRSRVRGHLRLCLSYLRSEGDHEDDGDDNSESDDEHSWEIISPQSRTEDDSQTENDETSREDDSLPPSWEMRRDDQGRIFYVNHQTRTTQWERPTASGNNGLPPGWEERVDRNGRTYYVDHNTRTTAWQRPTASTEQSDVQQQRRQEAATLFRQRHHISQEDTLSSGSFEDLRLGTVETPAVLQLHHPDSISRHSTQPPLYRSRTTSNSPSRRLVNSQSTAGEDDEPLPPGWAMSYAESGRPFFIDHNTKKTQWEDPRKRQKRSLSTATLAPESQDLNRASSNEDLTRNLGPLPDGWEERIHTNGRIFYINHKNKTTQWEDPRLQKLGGPAVKYSRNYKKKYDYFRSKLRKPTNVPNKVDIHVTRTNILEDSYRCIMNIKNADLLKTRLWIEFDGEHGLDYGGVAREFFYLISKEMFNPYYGLFEYSAIDDYTLQMNPLSGMANPEHLHYFRFIGRVVGMAVYHGKLIDAYFIRPFYKMMLGRRITLDDLESVDEVYYNSLQWILENDPEPLEAHFAVDEEGFGEKKEIELKPGGKDILVTEENKQEYIE